MAVKDHFKGSSRHEWPEELRRYDVAVFADERFARRAQFHAFAQFRFETEWRDLLDYAHAHGIQVIGDIPMYVSDNSADAWSEPTMFSLGRDGMPYEVAGVPPDRFSATGQVWGNPTYRWDEMRRDGYVWWLARLKRSFSLYDQVRLDHFLGFHNYFGIPAGEDGTKGRWLPGPGIRAVRAGLRGVRPLAAHRRGPWPFAPWRPRALRKLRIPRHGRPRVR